MISNRRPGRLGATVGVFVLLWISAASVAGQSLATAAAQDKPTLTLGADTSGKAPHEYVVPLSSGGPVVCRVLSTGVANSLRLKGLDKDGKDVVSTDQPGPFQLLVLPARAGRVQVANESGSAYPDYTLTCATQTGAEVENLIASGVAVRASISSTDYLGAYDFARTDWSQPKDFKADKPAAPVRNALLEVVGLRDLSNEEPVVLFIGIAGLAKILVIDPGTRANNPDRDNLRPTERLWVGYIEDDLTPYETSIDIQFNRASRVKFEQFEPGSAQLAAAAALRLIGDQPRPVRVGLKRVPLKLPMSLQIAFTRQGGLYGFRQWQKSLRVRRGSVDLSGSLFLAATEIFLNTYSLAPQDVPPLGSPDFNLIEQDFRRRQVFMAVRVGWPGIRAAGQDAVTTWDGFKGGVVPDLVLGMGLPPTGATAAYAGLAWPVPRLRWLHLSAGAAILWQGRLKDQPSPYPGEGGSLAVGSKVPLEWTEADIAGGTKPIVKFTFGLLFDLFTWP